VLHQIATMPPSPRLDRLQTILVVIDVQEKLMPVIENADAVLANIERLVRSCHILGVPTLVTQQYTKGLGPTVAPVQRALEESSGYNPIEKMCFSAARCEPFAAQVSALDRRLVLVAGVETHVCVYQTARDLLAKNLSVSIVADAVSSRTAQNREIALQRLLADGATITSTEMALFELTGVSGTDEFRAISKLVR
jgi:nicotinamidase-related amidase